MSRFPSVLAAVLLLAIGFMYVARVPRWQAMYADLGIPLPRSTTWCFIAAHDGAGYLMILGAIALVASSWVVHDPLHRTIIGVSAVVVACALAILTYAVLIHPLMAMVATMPKG